MKHKNKFKIIFLCLISYLVVQPLISNSLIILNTIFLSGLIIIFLFTPYLISRSRKWLVFGVVTVSAAVVLPLLNYNNNVYFYATNIFGLVAYFIVIMYIFQYIITEDEITDDLIYASLLGYFMIAIGFAHAYGVLGKLGYLKFNPEGIMAGKNNWDYLYYSFSTLTTLGYGDIVPVSPLARRLSGIEAATGVLYVAVFIGRLIGVHSIKKKEK
ncbi:MAG: hypothetical protein DRI44_02200 [Chlamydiae bacterium]|nr:MAG: hypothetical protein DRI44_02200 [Chlamydiota bacterium]